MTSFLELDHVHVELYMEGVKRPVIHDVTLSVGADEVVGVVGESGSGKSMTARTIMRLLPAGALTTGSVRLDGIDLLGLNTRELREVRSRKMAMVFQDPSAHINPVRRVGDFLIEALVAVRGEQRSIAQKKARKVLESVGIPDAERRMHQYPFELSGGLLQRVMIAATMLIEPQLLVADEPTTALDVTTQEEVMAILDEERRERGMAMILISHDLELVAAVCDRIVVMYAGVLIEELPASQLHKAAQHPYTRALLASRPGLAPRGEPLHIIPGRPLSAFEAPFGCVFATRCEHVRDICLSDRPTLRSVGEGQAACVRLEEIALEEQAEEVERREL